jgi:hypothetical protein
MLEIDVWRLCTYDEVVAAHQVEHNVRVEHMSRGGNLRDIVKTLLGIP